MHLFVDISSHGFGHLAITGPVLTALAQRLPELRLTVRSGLPPAKLAQRIAPPFMHLTASSDFGYVMVDATRVDLPASAAAYQTAHRDWPDRVAAESRFLSELAPDLVLSNVSYLPLAGARQAGIPAIALCSLNWADLFQHFFSDQPWAAPIHAEMLAAYRAATAFLRITPGMPMPDLDNVISIGSIAARGRRQDLGLGRDKAVLVAMGGIAHRLPIDHWPRLPGVRWIVAADWHCTHPDALPAESFGLSFTDLLASVDAVITKPGYGTFSEAAANATPVLYQRRVDWPEQECLIAWLHEHVRCREIEAVRLQDGQLGDALAALWESPSRPGPENRGAAEAAASICKLAGHRSGS